MGRRGGRGGGGGRGRSRDLFEIIFSRNNLGQILVALVVLLVVWSVANPYAVPAIGRGPNCARLPHPLGGNQRSLLQYTNADNQELDLEVLLKDPKDPEFNAIGNNDPLELTIVFSNNSAGPMYLYFYDPEPQTAFLRDVESAQNLNLMGLYLEISPVQSATQAGSPLTYYTENNSFPQKTQFIYESEVYVLRGKRSCHINITLEASRLRSAQILTGEFRVRAHYHNNNHGTNPPYNPNIATATPVQGMADSIEGHQGLWIGHSKSAEIRFRIGS